ncbi:DUF4276 family protein [Spirulina sp. CS-785/01]|uniref:DUF4276 family protein n=1 Tax=Spirulina sp. CS-785/01 TaxID=3021716 RepID=UPI003FA7EDD9
MIANVKTKYEAYLFCDPSCFTYRYKNCQNQIANLQAIVSQYETPELINDDPNTAPSKRIIAQFPEYKRDKTSAGPDLAAYIGLQEIRSHCPHFNGWLSKLERLGQ